MNGMNNANIDRRNFCNLHNTAQPDLDPTNAMK